MEREREREIAAFCTIMRQLGFIFSMSRLAKSTRAESYPRGRESNDASVITHVRTSRVGVLRRLLSVTSSLSPG